MVSIFFLLLTLTIVVPIAVADNRHARSRKSVPQIDVACTIYTLAKSCTTLLKDCGTLCKQVDISCNRLSQMSQIAAIACDDNPSMSKSLIFFKDAKVAKANGITDIEKFWSEVEKDPLKVVQMIMSKMIANGGLLLTPDQFLGRVDTGIGGTSTSISNNAVGNAVNKEVIGTGGKILDGSLTGQDLVDSGKAIGDSVGQGAKDFSNDVKNGLDSLTDINLDNIDDKAKDLANKALDSAKDLLDSTKNTFQDFLTVFDANSSQKQ